MQGSIGERWRGMIESAVESGRFASAEDVVTEAMRLLARDENRLAELRTSIAEALADPQEVSEEGIDAALAEVDAELRSEGLGSELNDA